MTEKKYLKWYNKVGYGSGDIAFTPALVAMAKGLYKVNKYSNFVLLKSGRG